MYYITTLAYFFFLFDDIFTTVYNVSSNMMGFFFYPLVFMDTDTNSHLQVHSPEDSFIELMAIGRVVMWNENHHLQAASLEGLVAELIEVNN